MSVVLIDYGAGNIQSVMFALQRLGINAVLSADPKEIRNADKVIFPGVGHANSAMNQLKKTGLDRLIPTLMQPVLGICLGMQLMCNTSEEGYVDGLGIFDTKVKRLPQNINVPHMGWNQIKVLESALFKDVPEGAHLYFVHSYYADLCPETSAKADYELTFSAALQKNNFYGCQFHPEKSGAIGNLILQNFLSL